MVVPTDVCPRSAESAEHRMAHQQSSPYEKIKTKNIYDHLGRCKKKQWPHASPRPDNALGAREREGAPTAGARHPGPADVRRPREAGH